MNSEINVAERLKDCPNGMELDCAIYDNVYLDCIERNPESIYPIRCFMKTNKGYEGLMFTRNGCDNNHPNAKCVIFPKGKTTWEGFQRPFKNGDIVAYDNGTKKADLFIFKESGKNSTAVCYLFLNRDMKLHIRETVYIINRFATEEEKRKLFDAIEKNGYRWNPEAKTLEKLIKPKFKVGDRIKHIVGKEEIATVVSVEESHYNLDSKVGTSSFSISLQREWELVSNKFDISTLVPFESKVLVRDKITEKWKPAIYGFIDSETYYVAGGIYWRRCIPFEGNEHLLGTTDDCDEFYKTWEDK